MASQVKKNKNQFLRKGIATSAVRNTLQDANIVDDSTIQSGVERIQIETPDVSSGVHSGVERVPTDIPILNSGVQSGVERVPIDTLILNSGVWSGTERDQINIPNVNSGEINGSLRNAQKCAEGVNLDALYKQSATNSCTEVGGRSVRSEEDSDAGGTMHACAMYNQSSEYVPKLHSESCSKPITDSISRSVVKNFAGKQTYDPVDNNHAPPLPKNPPPDLPAKPPRMAKYKTWHQHSSPANRGVNQRSTDLKHHSSKLQMEYSPQFSNNLNDDGEENEDLLWEYPGERTLIGQQMMASDIQYPNLKEHSQMHYGEEGILDNIEQGNQSSKAGHMLGGQYGEQTGQILGGHPGGHMQHMQGGLYTRNMGKMHPFGSDSGYTPSWQKERYSGQFQDGQHVTGFLMHGMEHVGPVPTRHHAGTMGPELNMHHAGTMGPGPTRHDAGAMGPGPNMHHAGTIGPGPTSHYAGAMGPGPNMHHAGTIGPEPTSHYAGAIGPGTNMYHAGTIGPGPTSHYARAMGPGPNMHHAGTIGPGPNRHHTGAMEPGPNMHHAGTMGQMPYQLNEGSIKQMYKSSVGQMHGGSVGQMYGGSVGQIYPYAQSEAMHSFGQEYMEEFQDVQYEHDDMGQPWTFPDTLQGYSQRNANYSPGASSFPGPSTNITDRELASGQLDQRMNNPWFEKLVQNMKELVEREGLIFKDVFPDGNCLFTAVIDQLRVRGNFNFTPSTLRAAAVAFLRENPKQHDGTHLEQFLMNESWDQYLSRMGKDGEWGEHIILGAMSEVLKCRIIVLGGMSGNSRTVVQPQSMSDEEEKKAQKEKEANGSEIVKDESLAGTAKSKVTAAESHSLQTGAASSTSKADAKTKGTDTSHRKVKTSSLSKQNKKDEELQMGEDLYIGLLGEMHYVSLRKKDWEERLNEKLRARIQKRKAKQRQKAGQIDDSSSDDDLCLPEDPLLLLSTDIVVDPASGEHLPHLDFIVKHISASTYLHKTKLCRHSFDSMHVHCLGHSKQIVGLHVAELELLPSIQSPRVHSLFQDKHSEEKCRICPECSIKNSDIITNYFTPDDTMVVFKEEEIVGANKDDIILKTKECGQGFVKLSPADPNLWMGQLLPDESGQLYLKHMQVDSKRKKPGFKIPCLISFRCSWPVQAKQWFERKKQSNWIPNHVAKTISKDTCRIIPSSHTMGQNSMIEWKYSFDIAEDKMIHCCVTPNYEKGFHAFKILVNTLVKESSDDFREVLRHTFFHACDNIDEEIWGRMPASCVLYLLTDLLHKLKSRFVPHYFMTSVNLMKDFSEETINYFVDKIKLLRYNPLVYIYFLLDNADLTSTELSKIFNAAVEDSLKLSLHGDIRRTKCEFLIPESISQICLFVSNQMYDKATSECHAAFEMMTSVENGITFIDLLQQILIELPLICRWCFAFFLDHSQGMSLLRIVCDGIPTESLVHIFGPGIVRHLGELNVPSVLICPKHVIDFVKRVTYIVSSLGLHLSVVVALNFFLMLIYDPNTGIYTFKNQSLEMIQIVEHSHGTCSCHKLPPRQRNLMEIAFLYRSFFDACWYAKRMDVFYPFVQRFRLVCENLRSEYYTSVLHRIHQCYEKTEDH